MSSRPLNYTTKIPARRTAGECLDLLAESGADAIAIQYHDRQPIGLNFRLGTPHGPRDFTLPVDVDGAWVLIQKALRADKPHVGRAELDRMMTREHAANVAWRVIRDWLEAQLAIIAAGLVRLDQVMLPYLAIAPGRTVWDAYLERESSLAAIEAGQ